MKFIIGCFKSVWEGFIWLIKIAVGQMLLFGGIALCIAFPPFILVILALWGWGKVSESSETDEGSGN